MGNGRGEAQPSLPVGLMLGSLSPYSGEGRKPSPAALGNAPVLGVAAIQSSLR